jgi:uncharacterized protein (UPF0548 family)
VFDVFCFSRPSASALHDICESQASKDVTYSGKGLSLGNLPESYDHLRAERVVGSGRDRFERGREAIRAWAGHRKLGLLLEPQTPPLEEGAVMAFAIPLRPSTMWATGSCRIIRVVDEPRRFGFAYGTLPHHPESGEEAFLVDHRDDDRVVFSVTAFSHPRPLPMKLSGPVGRIIQRRAAEVYLDGFEASTIRV